MSTAKLNEAVQTPGLYQPEFEHDNCGIGAVVNIKGVKSHGTVENALKIVENLEHRAGKDAEGKTGDGVGIMLQISHKFFSKTCESLGIFLGSEREYGIGMFFFPQDELKKNQAKKMFEIIVEKEGLKFLGWREVPVVPEVLGHKALECMPCIMQGFVAKPKHLAKGIDFDRRLYVVRRVFEQSNDNSYVVSLSSRTIVYKGMFLVGQYTLVSVPTQIRAGREHIRTALSYTTVRSTRSVEMPTRCLHAKRRCSPSISKESCTKFCRLSILPVLTRQCSTTHWNLW